MLESFPLEEKERGLPPRKGISQPLRRQKLFVRKFKYIRSYVIRRTA
jgi:hypothetical protein